MTVYHPKLTAAFWLAGMLFVCVFGVRILSQNWLETGFLALLPAGEQQPDIAQAIQRHNEPLNRKLIWLAGAATSSQAIAEARQLKQHLEQSRLFRNLMLEVPVQQYADQYRQLFRYRYQLLDGQTRAVLETDPGQLLRQNLELLNSPIGQMQAADLEHDPALIFGRYFNAQNPVKLNLEQGVIVLPDRQRFWAVLAADLQDDKLQLDKLETLSALVDSANAQVKAAGGELLVSGMPLFTAQGAESAKREISTVGVGSGLGIAVLLWATFRSVRPLLLSSLAIGSGLLAGLVATVLFFGKIHILTLVFGASLIGVADDYAQHFLCDSFGEQNWNPRKGLKFILPGLFFGLVSNLLSYAGLGFSPFPGLREVALFSAVGLAVAWLTVVLLFPLLLTGFNFDHEPGIFKLTTFWEQHWPVWVHRHRRWLGWALAFFVVGGLAQLKPQDDVRLLQSPPAELTAMAERIRQMFPMSPDNRFFLVSGKDQAEWHRNEQALLQRLETLKQQQALTAFQGLSDYWPDPDQQRQNYRLLKQQLYGSGLFYSSHALRGNSVRDAPASRTAERFMLHSHAERGNDELYSSGLLARYMLDLGFDRSAVQAEYRQFAESEQNVLALPDWLAATDEGKRQLWLGCDAQRCQSTVALIGVNNIEALAAVNDLPGVAWVDQVESLSSLFARYRVRASGLLLAAFCLASLGLVLKFGRRNAATIMAVPVASLAVSLAALGWFDQLFSLFNLFALLLVLGIGVDYGLFFFMAGDRRASTSLGVTLSALTTLLAFGLLAVSSTEIVHAFGFTVTVGIVTALLCAPLIGLKGER